jgi:hypothetical protein
MRTRRILVVALAVLGTGLFLTTPAQAGNWEETLLDPPPARIEQGVTYTFGYWILQHGSYPYEQGAGDLGPTELRADDGKGTILDFAGVKSATAGHYSAEVLFPHNGTWTISSQHEVLMTDPLVATVTVPGTVRIEPSQTERRAPYKWGPVHPSFPATAPDAGMAAPWVTPTSTPPEESRDVAERGNAVADPPGEDLPVWLVIVGGAATIALAVLLARRYRRANR